MANGEVKVWFAFYPGDYLKDTMDLTRAEHGTYLLTMLAYYSNGESLEDRKFRIICAREFERVSQFYQLEGGRWHHKRIDAELKRARENKEKVRLASQMGVEARKAKGQI